MASGVLVIGLGRGCKELAGFLAGHKAYLATGRFGKAYDTLDRTGVLTGDMPIPDALTEESFKELLATRFTGDIMQRPPAFSAVHVNGQRAYDLARRMRRGECEGEENTAGETTIVSAPVAALELPERPVHIERIGVTRWALPEFDLEIVCGGGTYVRSLIADSARAAGTLGAMYALERTRQGPFGLEDCLKLEDCADVELVRQALKQN
jgi:tRNA pseudouridine55 synthase